MLLEKEFYWAVQAEEKRRKNNGDEGRRGGGDRGGNRGAKLSPGGIYHRVILTLLLFQGSVYCSYRTRGRSCG